MIEKHTKAKFWKCALQVNPAGYIAYRGDNHGMTEEEYNQSLLHIAKENDIKVIGLADHGNVDGVDAIRAIMRDEDILVFPGFEIASSEKAHFVCLFSESTSRDDLIGYMARLEIDTRNPTHPSRLSAEQILSKTEELKGFIFAAHCIDDSGVLYRKLNHVWCNPLLKAAQIPGTLDELKNSDSNSYRQILLNKIPEYKRDIPIAILNSKDVANPEDLENPKASCLIKMTRPCFESFKLAFQDSESRVRLNSDVSEKHYSRIESLKVTGGYLDGLEIEFSEHLNAVIGGRGTGKSTLLECIRYALQTKPIGKNAQRQHDEIIKENLGKSKARVEIVIRSSSMNGKRFTIARRHGESPSIKDESGNLSMFSPSDLLPDIEIYGQNEIYEIAQNKASQRQLLARFFEAKIHDMNNRIIKILDHLSKNRTSLIDAQAHIASIEDEVARLPKLEERLAQFKTLGLEEKLRIVPLLETEKRLINTGRDEADNLENHFKAIRTGLPDTALLDDSIISHLPHVEIFRKLRTALQILRDDTELLLNQWQDKHTTTKDLIASTIKELNDGIQREETALEKTFKELPNVQGKTGVEIGNELQTLLRDIEGVRPKRILIEDRAKIVNELQQQRKALLDDLSSARADRSAQFERGLKSLNKKLLGKLKLNIKPEADRTPVLQFLLACKLENVAEGRLACLKDAEDFSPVKLAELIHSGANALRDSGWNITPTVAEALARLPLEQTLKLEELELPDLISIELNTDHQGQEKFKPLDKLSTGQQCTAILHLLLLQNRDPLIMDQPEDNLDNAFIADRIVAELRSAKIARQFIFATHNANIPVFGDAEWIGVFEAQDNQASMPTEFQGAIDVAQVRDKAADILEGGRIAFTQRKAKYGF